MIPTCMSWYTSMHCVPTHAVGWFERFLKVVHVSWEVNVGFCGKVALFSERWWCYLWECAFTHAVESVILIERMVTKKWCCCLRESTLFELVWSSEVVVVCVVLSMESMHVAAARIYL